MEVSSSPKNSSSRNAWLLNMWPTSCLEKLVTIFKHRSKAKALTASWNCTYLSVSVHHRSQKLPGATSAIHADHTQNLEEPNSAEGRGCEHLTAWAHTQHHERGKYGAHVCMRDITVTLADYRQLHGNECTCMVVGTTEEPNGNAVCMEN